MWLDNRGREIWLDAAVTGLLQYKFYDALYTRNHVLKNNNSKLLSANTSFENQLHDSGRIIYGSFISEELTETHLSSNPDTHQTHKNSVNKPLVSCIMPTRNRCFFISQSIKYFLNQDYGNKELIIIDDGDDQTIDIIPDLPNVFYYKYDSRLTLGEKRNIACKKANGDLIAHWDDDDWFSHQRLSMQIRYLLNSQSEICGFSNLYYYCPSSGTSWLYTYKGQESWIAGGTFVYKRELWQKHNFTMVNQAEDSIFLKNIEKNKILPIHDKNFYIGIIHTENTSAKYLDDPSWRQLPLSIISNLFGDDRNFYVNLRKAIVSRVSFTCSIKQFSKKITNHNSTKIRDINKQKLKPENTYPLVSCIMPTSNRVKFVSQSINYFLRQTYSNRELIIVDDGDYSVEDLMPDDLRIKYMKLSRKCSIGKNVI